MHASLPIPLPSPRPPSHSHPSPPPPPILSLPPSPPRQTVGSVLRAHRQSYVDGAGAVVLFFISTLLICGLQQLTASTIDFPAPILAMVLVAAVMILAAKLVPGIDGVYRRYLRGPTDLINRHMSIGFTVPFTMVMNEAMPTPGNVGLIIAGFLITGILNAVLAYLAAFGVQALLLSLPSMVSWRRTARREGSSDSASRPTTAIADRLPPLVLLPSLRIVTCSSRGSDTSQQQQPQQQAPQRAQEGGQGTVLEKTTDAVVHTGAQHGDSRIRSYISDATTLAHNTSGRLGSIASIGSIGSSGSSEGEAHPTDETMTTAAATLSHVACRAGCFAATHPLLCGSLAGVLLVGIPVAAATGSETPLDGFLLFFLWTGMLVLQAAVVGRGRRRSRWRPILGALLNAVLWSSLVNIAYLAAKAAASRRTTAAVLATFSTGTTLADRIHAPPPPPPPSSSTHIAVSASLGAGDLAASILDAGIVIWGLKLFECRAQLLSRAGATTLAVGALFAAANIVCGPTALHAMGLTPAGRALAFAARSVTLALAGPAMARLGGDVGLNAAMVVFNGIVFQVAMGLADAIRGAAGASPDEDIEANTGPSARSPFFPPRRGSDTSNVDTLADSIEETTRLDHALKAGDVEKTGGSGSSSSSGTGAGGAHQEEDKPSEAAVVVRLRGGERSAASSASFSASSSTSSAAESDAPATVALGTTVGINSAAMGTAYLYENAGRAAPYAALSMTVLGVMTVVLTSIQPLAAWVVSQVG